jgi:regulator of sigma E protease
MGSSDERYNMLGTAFDLLLVILGFGFIVFIHELGHFLAARWAGIRVLAFAVGFGPSVLTYRKGVGFKNTTSEPQYLQQLRNSMDAAVTAQTPEAQALAQLHRRISPTEYRLNILPFGGYVKMLGQEDLNPTATSAAPDSYQTCSPWKRMVVISAGVVMNIILAAILFIIVMMVGRQVDAPTVGYVEANSPAMRAVDVGTGASIPLQTGDRILTADGKEVRAFDDVMLAVAMSKKNESVTLQVERPGAPSTLNLRVQPQENLSTGLLAAGFTPINSTKIAFELPMFELPKGSMLLSVNGKSAGDGHAIDTAAHASNGEPLIAKFSLPDGTPKDVTLTPVAELQRGLVAGTTKDALTPIEHLLGLSGVLRVAGVRAEGSGKGIKAGDVVLKVGTIEFPSTVTGTREIRSRKGSTVDLTVARRNEAGAYTIVQLPAVKVDREGRIGFDASDSSEHLPIIAAPLAVIMNAKMESGVPSAASSNVTAGSSIIAVNSDATATLRDVALRVRQAVQRSETSVALTIRRPVAGDLLAQGPDEVVTIAISPEDAEQIKSLAWTADLSWQAFEIQQQTMKASNPLEALHFGYDETKRVMGMTYLTFARLAQGTVKIEHLKGPIGIAHLGTLVADRGFIWLLFFLALISVNLAVINFLPLPIVDGGQFLFLLYEAIRGKPVPVGFQNGVTMVGLVLIAGMFLVVTFNDVRNLLGI